MRKIFIILYLGLTLNVANSQSYYKRMYNIFNRWEGFGQLIDYNEKTGSSFVVGYSINLIGNDSSSYGIPYLVRLNDNGDLGVPKCHYKNGYHMRIGGENSRYLSDGTYLLNFNINDTNGNYEELLYIIDTASLDTVRTKHIELPSPKHHTTQIIYNNYSEYRIGSLFDSTGKEHTPFLLVTDTNGVRKAYRNFASNKGYLYNIMFTKDNNIFFGGIYGYSPDDSRLATWYGVMDTTGNIIWEKILEDSSISPNYRGVFVTGVNEHYYLYGGERGTTKGFVTISEVNIHTGAIKWSKRLFELGDSSNMNIFAKKSHDNNLFITADYQTGVGTPNNQQYGLLLKLDTTGTIIWKRLFQEANAENMLWDLNFVSDGMILLGDARSSTNFQKSNAWIIRTDTFGCIVPGCQLIDGIPQIMGEGISFMVYPNPSATEVKIRYNKLNTLDTYSIKVLDVNAKVVHDEKLDSSTTEHILSTNKWTNGTYFLQIISRNSILAGTKLHILR